MIKDKNGDFINPAYVTEVFKRKSDFREIWCVNLYVLNETKAKICFFDNEKEADAFIECVCNEIDKINGIYDKSAGNNNEENIN